MIVFNTDLYTSLSTAEARTLDMITRAEVTEELNGIYEFEFDILINDSAFAFCKANNLVRARVSTDNSVSQQIFRIYEVVKTLDELATVRCRHITYDLAKVPITPFSATGISAVLSALNANMMTSSVCSFSTTTDIANTSGVISIDHPVNAREIMGGMEGSLLDVFRCEYKYDGTQVYVLDRRGEDNGVRIQYGKNLLGFNQQESSENVYTGVLGYAVIDEVIYTGNIYTAQVSAEPKTAIVDFSSRYSSDSLPTTASLTADAQGYASSNGITNTKVSIETAFIDLASTDEYKGQVQASPVALGDTVHIYVSNIGVEYSARVNRTVYNVLIDNYDSIEVGTVRANLNTAVSSLVDNRSVTVNTGGTGTSNYNDLINKPSINGITLQGNITIPTVDGSITNADIDSITA